MSLVLDGTNGLTGNSGTLLSNSTIGVGGTTPAASGAGISFPATQSASSDVNTLDDYEEGIFTPTAVGTTSAGVGTYDFQVGKYTKIGNAVYFTIVLAWSAHTGTGNLRIAGLPFADSGGNSRYSFSAVAQKLVYTNQLVCLNSGSGATSIDFYTQSNDVNLSAVAMDTVVTYMTITGTYFIS